MTPERDARLAAQAAELGRQDVVRLLDLLADALEGLANGAQARIQLELALVKAAAPEVDPSTRALLVRIDRLEAQLGGAAPAPPAVRPAPPVEPEPPAVQPAPEPIVAPPAPRRESVPPPAAVAVVDSPPSPAPAPPPEGPPDVEALRVLWPAVVDAVRAENAMLAAALAEARPVAVAAEEATFAFPAGSDFLKKKAETEEHRRLVVEALRTLAGAPLRPRYELREPDAEEPQGDAPGGAASALSGEELVARFVAEFDAEEIDDEGGA
jgi:DNA polymerase-3 subunit gamma/tau